MRASHHDTTRRLPGLGALAPALGVVVGVAAFGLLLAGLAAVEAWVALGGGY